MISMIEHRQKEWEVWLAYVKFEDMPDVIKERPVIILADKRAYLISLKVTSAPPREHYYGEYVLKEWRKAGLAKESTVRISKKLKLIETDFVRKLGRVTPIDIMQIRFILAHEN